MQGAFGRAAIDSPEPAVDNLQARARAHCAPIFNTSGTAERIVLKAVRDHTTFLLARSVISDEACRCLTGICISL